MKASLFYSAALRILTPAVMILAADAAAHADDVQPADGKPGFRTEAVVRKNLMATVDATGTLEPEEVIDVGAQVAGLIQKFGPADPKKPDGPTVDYCTPVKRGQVLAVIDPAIYQVHLNQAKAAFVGAKAVLKKAEVSRDALRDVYQREKDAPAAIPQAQLSADKAAYEIAAVECDIQGAAVAQAEAALKEAELNLNYCTISAPVDGVIVDRRVNVGQTVVASLSAPSLFLLAKDLTKMQVWASVNEADIGNIHVGQEATFTVDARPGKIYKGEVSQIRLNASMEHDVVAYTVVVDADNPLLTAPEKGKTTTAERELLPYLTAHVTFHVAERKDALAAPNAALRWRPQLQQVDPKFRDEYEQFLRKKAAEGSKPGAQGGVPGVVWVQDGVFVRPIRLVIGLTDGAMTQVVSVHEGDSLDEGTAVVTGERQPGDATIPPPFVPKKINDDK